MKYYTAEEIEQLKKNLSELNYEELLEYEQYLIDTDEEIEQLKKNLSELDYEMLKTIQKKII